MTNLVILVTVALVLETVVCAAADVRRAEAEPLARAARSADPYAYGRGGWRRGGWGRRRGFGRGYAWWWSQQDSESSEQWSSEEWPSEEEVSSSEELEKEHVQKGQAAEQRGVPEKVPEKLYEEEVKVEVVEPRGTPEKAPQKLYEVETKVVEVVPAVNPNVAVIISENIICL